MFIIDAFSFLRAHSGPSISGDSFSTRVIIETYIYPILEFLLLYDRTGWDGMDWIDLAEDRDKWRALVNTAMNLRVP
jgi:hypothetical protein